MDGNITSFGLNCVSILLEIALIICVVCSRQRRRHVSISSVCCFAAGVRGSACMLLAHIRFFIATVFLRLLDHGFSPGHWRISVGVPLLPESLLPREEDVGGWFVCCSSSSSYWSSASHAFYSPAITATSFTLFIIEFNQNLYFTCLVLNTLLYILLQQIDSADDELGLLVCGVGIQFAGPAATLALLTLTTGEHFAHILDFLYDAVLHDGNASGMGLCNPASQRQANSDHGCPAWNSRAGRGGRRFERLSQV